MARRLRRGAAPPRDRHDRLGSSDERGASRRHAPAIEQPRIADRGGIKPARHRGEKGKRGAPAQKIAAMHRHILQSRSFVFQSVVARIVASTELPIQNQITGPKS